MKKFFLLLFIKLFLLSSCGYEIVNNVYDYQFEIKKIQFSGDQNINNKLEKHFSRFEEKDNATRFFDLNISSQLIKKTTSKNSAGEDLSYSIKVLVNVDIIENNENINKASFEKNINYNTLNSKFELRQYEKVLTNDLVEQIILDINMFLGSVK